MQVVVCGSSPRCCARPGACVVCGMGWRREMQVRGGSDMV